MNENGGQRTAAPLVHGRMVYRCECCGESWFIYLEKHMEREKEDQAASARMARAVEGKLTMWGEEVDQRMEVSCSRCGKVRVLSMAEADADGWRASMEGLICPRCNTGFGIPLDGLPRQTEEERIEAMRLRRYAEKIVYSY